jgi:hypothetical protein
VSRRFSVPAGFYRTCVLDSVLEHSPAEHVRRPAVPAAPPALGFTHLQFEALRDHGPILLNTCGSRMDRYAAIHRTRHLAETADIQGDLLFIGIQNMLDATGG